MIPFNTLAIEDGRGLLFVTPITHASVLMLESASIIFPVPTTARGVYFNADVGTGKIIEADSNINTDAWSYRDWD